MLLIAAMLCHGMAWVAAEEVGMIWSAAIDLEPWPSIDDRVMGGVSKSGMVVRDGVGVFSGVVSLDNNGGFASVRSLPSNHQLSGSTGVVIRVRGDGRRYRFRLRTSDAADGVSYQAPFEPGDGEWREVAIAFETMEPVLRGRRVEGHPPLDPAKVRTLGLMIADRQAGPFRLELEWIRGFSEQ